MPLDLVDLTEILVVSIVFAEIYRRILIRRLLARTRRALQAVIAGQDTPDTQAGRAIAQAGLAVALRAVLVKDDEDKWHLTPWAKKAGRVGLQAIEELVKTRPGSPSSGGIVGLDFGALDLDRLLGVGIGLLPKKHQGIAAIVAGTVLPIVRAIAPGILGGRPAGPAAPVPKKSSSSSVENPFLEELKR